MRVIQLPKWMNEERKKNNSTLRDFFNDGSEGGINLDLPSKRLIVCRILRDNPNLRRIENRQMVWKLAKQQRGDITWPQVDRLCRQIQNTDEMYLPQEADARDELEKEYKEFFRRGE